VQSYHERQSSNLHKVNFSLNNTAYKYNFKISAKKSKVFVFTGTEPLRAEAVINDKLLEHVHTFN
jgi:hypothetical protein